jgi:chaperone required for assembly of F1-ATPase
MTKQKLEQAMVDIKNHRNEVIEKLMQFSATDAVFFWNTEDNGLAEKQEEVWAPVLDWASKMFNSKYAITANFDVPEQGKSTKDNFKNFMKELSDRELAAFYLASINMKSELLAAALVKGQISANQAFDAACLEEHWQVEHWGKDAIEEQRKDDLRCELNDIESFLKR